MQTGYGRTGRLFACEHHELVPDVICLGKAMAGGVPMGATAVGGRVAELKPGVHGTTFGGNPLACAAALATLDVMRDEHLPERSAELGAALLDRLQDADIPGVREVRGLGLMIGIECRARVTPALMALMARGFLALPAGPTVLRLLPPLIIERDDLDRATDAVIEVLTEVAGKGAAGDDDATSAGSSPHGDGSA